MQVVKDMVSWICWKIHGFTYVMVFRLLPGYALR